MCEGVSCAPPSLCRLDHAGDVVMRAVRCAVEGEGPGETMGGAVGHLVSTPTCVCALHTYVLECVAGQCASVRLSVRLSTTFCGPM